MTDKSILIKEYLIKIKSANKELTKKEAFNDLLNRLYAGNAETKSIIDDITLGAEKTIVNIPANTGYIRAAPIRSTIKVPSFRMLKNSHKDGNESKKKEKYGSE